MKMEQIKIKEAVRFFALAFSLFFFVHPFVATAATDITVSPAIIDGKGKQREILRYSVAVENTTKHVLSVYPWVVDVDGSSGVSGAHDTGGASQDKDISTSLARWMEITRGAVDLLPGEKKDVPLTVQINLNAKPGIYHSIIHLSPGGDRAQAEANTAGTVDVRLNIEVLEDINERVQLAAFVPIKNIFTGDEASFQYNLENIGNRGVIPHGKIRIYDRRGEEVATIDANHDGTKLEPSAKEMLSSVWASNGNFGRYKAMLDLEYGGRGTLQDTVFFWVIPWKKVGGMFLALMIFCVILAIGLHSYASSRREGEFSFAHAGRRWSEEQFRAIGAARHHEDEYEEEIEVSQPEQRFVDELREVTPPEPVHTRLYSRVSRTGGVSTRLAERQPVPVSKGHQVHLVKREKAKPHPDHVVTLKRK